MRDAAMNVLVPRRASVLMRMASRGDPAKTGSRSETSEHLPGESDGSWYWNETHLHIAGGGNSTMFYFLAGKDPGTYPVKVRLFDDLDERREYEVAGTYTVPPRSVDEKAVRHALDKLSSELRGNRTHLRFVIGRGMYCPEGAPALAIAEDRYMPGLASNLDPERKWPELQEALERAYVSAMSVHFRAERVVPNAEGIRVLPPDDHEPERALAETLNALVKLEQVAKGRRP